MQKRAFLGFPLAAFQGRTAFSATKATSGIAPPQAVFAAILLLLLESSLTLKLLHSVVMLHFSLPGCAIDLL